MFKTLTTAFTTGLITLALAAGLSTGGAQAMSTGTIDKVLIKTDPQMFGLIKAEFRADYDNFIAAVQYAEATGGDIRSTAAEQVIQWRLANADVIANADDWQHIELLSHYTDALAYFRGVGGAVACGEFILQGSATLSTEELNVTYQEPLDYYFISMMETAAAARDSQVRRKPVSDADWDRVFDVMEDRGATMVDLDALIAMDANDPAFCDATIRFIDALLVDGDKAISRVRAEYIASLVQSV